MAQGRRKAKVVADPSRGKKRQQPAVREPDQDNVSYKAPQPKEDASAATACRRSLRIAAQAPQSHENQTLQPKAHHNSRGKPTATQSKQAAARSKLATSQGKPKIQPRHIGDDLDNGDPITAPNLESDKKARGRPKKAARPIGQAPQAPGSGNQRPTAGTSSGKATKPGAHQKQAGGKSSKAQLATAAKHPIPIDSSPPAFVGESRDRHSAEQPQLPNPTTALTRKALEQHTRNTVPIDLVDQIRTIRRISRLLLAENSVEAQSSDTIDIDRQEIFNYKWGYLPALGEEAECVLLAILEDPTVARIMARIGPDSGKFREGLEFHRNVKMSGSSDRDPRAVEINALNLKDFLPETTAQQRCHDELWRLDKAKCTGNSSEALFQRTLMISLIARHTLLYPQGIGKSQALDFSVEELWQCPPMPTKAVWDGNEGEAFFLTQPKPDLSLCFNRASLIPDDMWMAFPDVTRALASFENTDSRASRVFHFLTVEAKKAMTDIDADKAKFQSLNNASQALHNMYEFFSDAGSGHKRAFFDNVRFFSVVANRKGMLVRIHRALEIPQDAHPRSLIMPDQPQYRLRFEYEEFARLEAVSEYSRERVLNIFKRILKYAVEDLGEMIKAAAAALATTLMDDSAYAARANDEGFYRHGQPGPESIKLNVDGSLVPSSRVNRLSSVKKRLLEATLNTNHWASMIDQTMRSKGDTERPPEAEPLSQKSNGAKKRTSNDREAGSDHGENPQEANKRPRRHQQAKK